jgi:putative transcriptional regulator
LEIQITLEKALKISSPFVGQRIKQVRKSLGLTLDRLGQLIGISNQALSAIESGKANPSRQTLIGLARVLKNDFNEDWLRDYAFGIIKAEVRIKPVPGAGKYQRGMFRRMFEEAFETRHKHLSKNAKSQKGLTVVPLACEITSGVIFNFYTEGEHVIVPPHMLVKSKRVIAVSFHGDPIRDAFLTSGDIVILAECPNSVNGELILAYVNEKLMLRQWTITGEKARLSALDVLYEPIEVPVEQVECLGEVTGLLRSTKRMLESDHSTLRY